MGQENCKNNPHESMGSMDIKPWKTMESMGIYKNGSRESMGSMVFSSILLSMIHRQHEKHGKHGKIAWERMGKHGIYANEFIPRWFPGSS